MLRPGAVMSACWIALGGNVGDVAQTFQRALARLNRASGVAVVQRSRTYTTAPVGTNSGTQFLNAVAELRTSLSPQKLLTVLQSIETELGRIRSLRWGPRTLDLDLLLYDQQVLVSTELTIPHPHLWYRRFVLDPLVEIAPDVLHPQHQMTIAALRTRLLVRPLPCLLQGGAVDERFALERELSQAFPNIVWTTNEPDAAWLVFSLQQRAVETAPRVCEIPAARVIDLTQFPTAPQETLCDILTAALDSARVADHME